MERPINDFDEDVFRLIGGETAEGSEDKVIDFYDPLSHNHNRLNMKLTDDDYFGETPAFI